jgi:hypothetical protein
MSLHLIIPTSSRISATPMLCDQLEKKAFYNDVYEGSIARRLSPRPYVLESTLRLNPGVP